MSEWKECTVDELCLKITDGSHFSPREVELGFPMFSVKDMEENGFSYKSVKKISLSDYKKLEKSDCKPLKNDVLIAKDGSYLKHVFVCKEEREVVILSSIAILRPDTEKINPDYFKYILSSPTVKNMMANYVSGVAIPRIILNDFKKMTLNIPTEIPTQQKIAHILGTYDELIEVNNERIKLLEETAQSLYKEWFVRFRFPNYQETEFIKGVPKGWEVVRVAEAFEILGGGTPDTTNPNFWDGEINWFSPTNITNTDGIFLNESTKKITKDGLRKSSSKMFPKYSVMMTSRATIGAVGINTVDACTNQGFITCLPNKFFPMEYLYFWVQENKEYFEMLASGSTFLEISKSSFKKIFILKATEEIIDKYEEYISPVFSQIETLQQQNTELRQIRDRLLPRLISGKIEF
jgi:type I restriction enzyme, S subunit